MLSDILFRLRSLFKRRKVEAELDDELRFHFEQQVEKDLRAGLAPAQAVRRAKLLVGGIDQIKEECREARGTRWMESLGQDLRYAARTLCKRPGFAMVAVLTLALGIGANTAIFSIVNAVLLRSLPYSNPERLVRIMFSNPGVGLRDVPFSVPELDDLRTRSGVFDDVTAVGGGSVNLTGAPQPERLDFIVTHPNYFSMLGALPQIGRLFGPQDQALGFAPVAVISDGLWRRSYGADPAVLGRTLHLDNDPYTVVGVLPPGFRHPEPAISRNVEVFLTAGFSADPTPKPVRNARVLPAALGRLKAGLTVEQAQTRLTALAVQLRRDYPGDYSAESKWTIEIQSLREALVGQVRPMLLVVMGAVLLIVFIVSLNIANLLLARASGRQQEIAIRLALGASRGRMIRQMLTESLLLSGIGGLAGVATAYATLSFILHFIPSNIPRLSEVNIDGAVLAFAVAVSLFTGVLFGLAPAIQSTRSNLSARVREGGRGAGDSARTGRVRDALIVSEVALAVVLLVGAGLLLRTLRSLLQENPGFNPTQVVAARVWLPIPNNPKEDPYIGIARKTAFNRELLRRMQGIPGVSLAGITSALPATPHDNLIGNVVTIEDRPIESSQDLRAEMIRISPDYLRVMQTPLVRGRFFTDSDQEGKPLVAIIDETTARRYWTDGDPLGRRLRFGQDRTQPWMTVVGIVKDIKNDGLDIDGVPHIYVSLFQNGNRDLSVVLRTSLPAAAVDARMRAEVQSIDPGLPVFDVSSMNEVIDASLASRRFSAVLVGGFAGLAVLLASIGIYGLLAYMVGQRSREIGLRLALGARPGDIRRLILRKGVVLAGAGALLGVILSASAASLMATLLYGVRPHDPAVFVFAPVLLFAVAALASYVPARRATKADPVVALREV